MDTNKQFTTRIPTISQMLPLHMRKEFFNRVQKTKRVHYGIMGIPHLIRRFK